MLIDLTLLQDFKDEDYSDPDSPFTVLYPEQSNEEQTASNCANSEAESTGNGDDQCSTGSPPKSPSPSPNQRPRRTKKETTVFDPGWCNFVAVQILRHFSIKIQLITEVVEMTCSKNIILLKLS